MAQIKEVMSQERLDRYIDEAARAAGYEAGFGIRGCDLDQKHWWVAYARQSSKEQAENDRLGEYLLTCAKMAKQRSAIVPREYVIYDSDSSEDFDRPGINPTSAVTRLERGSPKRNVYTTFRKSSCAGAGVTGASVGGSPGPWLAGRYSGCG